MKSPASWNDETELFEAIYEALEDAGLRVRGSEERGEYGEDGTLDVIDESGRRFRIDISQIS